MRIGKHEFKIERFLTNKININPNKIVFDYLTKIRNALVHARERRENKVILPSRRNDIKLNRIRTVIARIAEQIAISAL